MGNYIKTDKNNKVEVKVEVDLIREGDYIVAYCPALELSSFGTDESDARLAFDEALEIFFEETIEMGTLENILLDLGWGLRKVPQVIYQPPAERIPLKYAGTVQSRFNEVLSIPV